MPTPRVHMIHTATQLKALAAAARQEIVDVLEQLGTVSVADLVRHAGDRVRPGGKEALFCTAKPALQLRYEPRNAGNRRAVSAVVASMMRMANRDFQRSFRPGQVVVSGVQRELWALRIALPRTRICRDLASS